MDAVWVNELYIGTAYSSSEWTYAKLCKGIEGMTFNENEQNQQFFFLCGEGFANNEVTGAAPELQVTGRRVVGDTAQDFIAGLQFKMGSERVTSVKVTTGGKIITCDAVVTDIVTFGGNSADLKPFNCNIRFNGKPSVTDVPSQ